MDKTKKFLEGLILMILHVEGGKCERWRIYVYLFVLCHAAPRKFKQHGIDPEKIARQLIRLIERENE